MLSLLWSGDFSAADLARELGISHGLASQHLRKLREAALVEPAGTETRRGGQAHTYRAVRGTPLSDLSRDPRAACVLAETMALLLRERATRHDPRFQPVMADAELWVHQDDWDRARQAMLSVVTELHDNSHPPRTEGCIPISLTVAAFPIHPGTTTAEPGRDQGPARVGGRRQPPVAGRPAGQDPEGGRSRGGPVPPSPR